VCRFAITYNFLTLIVDPAIAPFAVRESSLRTSRGADGAPAFVSATVASNAIEVVTTSLDLSPESVVELARLLSDAERQRASRFAFDRDRRRFTVARARLRELLAARLGVQPQNVAFRYGVHGKPALAHGFADSKLCFNVSHSEDIAVYAFALDREVGIDVEAVRPLVDADAVAARFFSRQENEAYSALDPHDRPLGFFYCWTRKEAFIKAIGDGLSYPLDCFDVSLAPGQPAKILRVGDRFGADCGWTMEAFSPAPGFVAAVATESTRHRAIESSGTSQRTEANGKAPRPRSRTYLS
jgi:4'-phosphopantetheinyl transferase